MGDFVEGWVWVWLDREDKFVSLFQMEGNNKKYKKNEYFIEKMCRIDKLVWVFCKSGCIK